MSLGGGWVGGLKYSLPTLNGIFKKILAFFKEFLGPLGVFTYLKKNFQQNLIPLPPKMFLNPFPPHPPP
jgi:hypothetical protein